MQTNVGNEAAETVALKEAPMSREDSVDNFVKLFDDVNQRTEVWYPHCLFRRVDPVVDGSKVGNQVASPGIHTGGMWG